MPRRVLFWAWPRFDRAECAFWRSLRDALHARRLTLVLASSTPGPSDLDVEHVTMTATLDAFWPGAGVPAGLPVPQLGLDPDALLAREAEWGGPALVPAIQHNRRTSLDRVAAECVHWLQTLAPVATVIWNGQHVPELILAEASRLGGAPVLYVERAPIADALFVDERGLVSASAVAAERPWPAPSRKWRRLAASVCRDIVDSRRTWWEQPEGRTGDRNALRASLGIPGEARVVLFAGQVDEDTQSFLFSPRHRANIDAFEWLLDALRSEPRLYVLGKHHPRSLTPAARYRERLAASGVQGAWRDDVSIDDALLVADRVAAVNSTVLYEALARRRPVLAMGEWLLMGQGAAYEPLASANAVDEWLRADDIEARLARWHDALGHLLSRSIYAFEATGSRAGMHSAPALARRIAASACRRWRAPERLVRTLMDECGARSAHWSPGDPAWTCRRDAEARRLDDWHRGQSVRHALLPAWRAGREKRRVLVWSDGTTGRTIHDLLRAAGVCPEGLLAPNRDATSDVAMTLGPEEIRLSPTPDFVVVGMPAPEGAVQYLDACGLRSGDDYSVIAPHLLPWLARAVEVADDAA